MDDDRICWPTEEACQCVLTFQPRELGITFGHVAERAGFVLESTTRSNPLGGREMHLICFPPQPGSVPSAVLQPADQGQTSQKGLAHRSHQSRALLNATVTSRSLLTSDLLICTHLRTVLLTVSLCTTSIAGRSEVYIVVVSRLRRAWAKV